MNDVESILFGGIEKWGLPINIILFKIESLLNKEVKTFFFAISADVEENGLLVAIFEVWVSSIVNKKFHDLIWLFVIDENSWEVECGLPSLSLKAVHKYSIILCKKPLDLFYRTAYQKQLPTLDRDSKLVNNFISNLFVMHK